MAFATSLVVLFYCCATADILTKLLQQCFLFLSHLLIARCDIGVQLSVRSLVRSSVHNLCQGAYSVAVIAGSMKPCIVITLDTHFKKAP